MRFGLGGEESKVASVQCMDVTIPSDRAEENLGSLYVRWSTSDKFWSQCLWEGAGRW